MKRQVTTLALPIAEPTLYRSTHDPERPGQVGAIAGHANDIDALRQIIEAVQPPRAPPGFDLPLFGRSRSPQQIDDGDRRAAPGGEGVERQTEREASAGVPRHDERSIRTLGSTTGPIVVQARRFFWRIIPTRFHNRRSSSSRLHDGSISSSRFTTSLAARYGRFLTPTSDVT